LQKSIALLKDKSKKCSNQCNWQ